jgi:hypothetical protein
MTIPAAAHCLTSHSTGRESDVLVDVTRTVPFLQRFRGIHPRCVGRGPRPIVMALPVPRLTVSLGFVLREPCCAASEQRLVDYSASGAGIGKEQALGL